MGYTFWLDGPTGEIVSLVYRERLRQDELKLSGKFPYTAADNALTYGQKLAILVEEVGEVARGMNETVVASELKAELIQVAAVAVAWAESL